MINRLIAMTMVCIFALSGAGYAAVKGDDTLPPLVIETSDLKYVGITVDMSKSPTITARRITKLHEEPSPASPVVGSIDKFEKVNILDTKAYIYPRMGKTQIVSAVPERDAHHGLVLSENDEYIPKTGDTVYLIYYRDFDPSIVWYKNHFITIPHNGIKMPLQYGSRYEDGILKKPYCSNDPVYAIYEGYTNPKDVALTFKPYIECPGDREKAGDNIGVGMSNCIIFFGDDYRRNADIWLYVETNNKEKGWVQLIDAHKGANDAEQMWWRQQTVKAEEAFKMSLTVDNDAFCDEENRF